MDFDRSKLLSVSLGPFFSKFYQRTVWYFSHKCTVQVGDAKQLRFMWKGKLHQRYCHPVPEIMINAAVACFPPICLHNLVWKTGQICHCQMQ